MCSDGVFRCVLMVFRGGLGGFRLAHLLLEHEIQRRPCRKHNEIQRGRTVLAYTRRARTASHRGHLYPFRYIHCIGYRTTKMRGLGAFRLRVVTRPVRLPPHFPGLAIPSFKPHSGSGPPGKQIISRMAP